MTIPKLWLIQTLAQGIIGWARAWHQTRRLLAAHRVTERLGSGYTGSHVPTAGGEDEQRRAQKQTSGASELRHKAFTRANNNPRMPQNVTESSSSRGAYAQSSAIKPTA